MFKSHIISLLIILFIFITSCSSSQKLTIQKDNDKLLNTVLNNYCKNYNFEYRDSITLSYQSIFEDIIKNSYFRNKPINLIKESLFDDNSYINKFLPIKITNNKVEVLRYKKKKIVINKKDFFRILPKVSLKKMLKKEYNFLGEITFYYKIYEFYVDNNGKKVYMKTFLDRDFLKEVNIEVRIKKYLELKKYIKKPQNMDIKNYINSIIQELNIYPQKKSIIIEDNTSKVITVTIQNKKVKSKIKILINKETNKVLDIIYTPRKLYGLEPLINHNKYKNHFNCKENGEK